MTSRHVPVDADHARHDLALVAGLASRRGLDGPEREAAEQLVAGCSECRALAHDLRALASSTRHDLRAPRRPRDFRLSAADAERLRGSRLERLLAAFASPSTRLLQPFAAAALSIGLVMATLGAAGFPSRSAPAGGQEVMVAPVPHEDTATHDALRHGAATAAPAAGAGGAAGGPETGGPAVAGGEPSPAAPVPPKLPAGGVATPAPLATFTVPVVGALGAPTEQPAAGPPVESGGVPGGPDAPGALLRVGLALAAVGFGVLLLRSIGRRRTEDGRLR